MSQPPDPEAVARLERFHKFREAIKMSSKSDPLDASATSILTKVGAYTVALPLMIVTLVPLLFWHAYVLAMVWNWFMPSLFELPRLGMGGALAVGLVYSAIRRPGTTKGEPKLIKMLFASFLRPLITLGFAWGLHRAILAGWLAF